MTISTEDPFRHAGTHVQILENADNHIFPVEETLSYGGGNADKNDTANNDAHDLPQIYKNVLTKTTYSYVQKCNWRNSRFDPPTTTFTDKAADIISRLLFSKICLQIC